MEEKLIITIIADVLRDYNYVDIEELMTQYSDSEEDLGEFCDRFELGNYIYELFGRARLELSDVLRDERDIAKKIFVEEVEEIIKNALRQVREDYDN